MPHKRNPIICERITGLARILRGYAQAALEDHALWGERDITHSSVERIAIPGGTGLLHYMLRRMAFVLDGLRVSYDVMLARIARGRTREQAYRIVQDASMAAVEGGASFREGLRRGGLFGDAELDG